MDDTIARFGFNTDLEHDKYTAWYGQGSKYNFNIDGKVLGYFSENDKDFLLSQVTRSFGDNCMVGTIDVREVTFEGEFFNTLISNNDLSEECMIISRSLSGKNTQEELKAGIPIEQTEEFKMLTRIGINLERQNVQLGNEVTVCGVEPAKFEKFKNANKGKTR